MTNVMECLGTGNWYKNNLILAGEYNMEVQKTFNSNNRKLLTYLKEHGLRYIGCFFKWADKFLVFEILNGGPLTKNTLYN